MPAMSPTQPIKHRTPKARDGVRIKASSVFKNALAKEKSKLTSFLRLDFDDIDDMVSNFTDIMHSAASKCNVIKPCRLPCRKKGLSTVKKRGKPWYNQSLKETRRSLFSYCKLLSQFPRDPFIRGKVFTVKKLYKKQCRMAKAMYYKLVVNDLSNLNVKDPKSFWDYLKKVKKNDTDTTCKSNSSPISADCWYSHFKSTLSDSTSRNDFQKHIINELESCHSK